MIRSQTTASTHGPCVCVKSAGEGVPDERRRKDKTARRRRVCDDTHAVAALFAVLWWWCVCCRCNVDSIVDQQVYITSNVARGVGK